MTNFRSLGESIKGAWNHIPKRFWRMYLMVLFDDLYNLAQKVDDDQADCEYNPQALKLFNSSLSKLSLEISNEL
jgi:hypothetical protein